MRFDELSQRQVVSLDQSVYVVYGGHLGITSVADTLSFPQGHRSVILRYSPECVESGILGSSPRKYVTWHIS